MKMDCYPRFKKSELAKECLLCEMEGRPLPMAASPQQPQKTQQSQYTGIWSKHRVGGALKSCDLMQMCILYCTVELYDLILAVFSSFNLGVWSWTLAVPSLGQAS